MTFEDKLYEIMPRELKDFLRGVLPKMKSVEFEQHYKVIASYRRKNKMLPLKYLKFFEGYFSDKDLFYEMMRYSYKNNRVKSDEEDLEWEDYLIRRSGLSKKQYREQVRNYYKLKDFRMSGL